MEHWPKILRSSLYASFGAGIGFAFAIWLITIVPDVLLRGDVPIDCSTAKNCGLTVVNTALVVISILVGLAGLALFGAAVGVVYAIPIAFVLGSFLYFRALRKQVLDNRYVAYLLGAIGGVMWWLLLDYLDFLPLHSGTRAGFPVDYEGYGTDPSMLIGACFGGVVSTEMFLRWLQTEFTELGTER